MRFQQLRSTLLTGALFLVGCGAQGPRLVVVLSVDQMRADYLDRFGPQFTGGFRWLIDRGAVFNDAHQDHAVTSTAPGHATIATGVFPSRHGIVAKNWYDEVPRPLAYQGPACAVWFRPRFAMQWSTA